MKISAKRTVVDIDTRRTVIMQARARRPSDVLQVPHEVFIRRTLKERMGWGVKEPAPETIRNAAKEMAAALMSEAAAQAQRMKAAAEQIQDKVEQTV